jgi:hypothetical protein
MPKHLKKYSSGAISLEPSKREVLHLNKLNEYLQQYDNNQLSIAEYESDSSDDSGRGILTPLTHHMAEVASSINI